MYYRQYWKDPRLSFSNANLEKMVITDLETIDRVWQPDSFILNELKGSVVSKFQFLKPKALGIFSNEVKNRFLLRNPVDSQFPNFMN